LKTPRGDELVVSCRESDDATPSKTEMPVGIVQGGQAVSDEE